MSDPTSTGKDRATAARGFWAINDRTKSSIVTTMTMPLAWMSDDRARDLGDADSSDPQLVDAARRVHRPGSGT